MYQTSLTDRTHWQLRAALNNSHADIGTKDPGLWQKRDTDSVFVQSNLQFDFSANHRSQLQVYWQREERAQRQYECVSTVLLDPALFDLYRLNPQGTLALIENPLDEPDFGLGLYDQLLKNAGLKNGLSALDDLAANAADIGILLKNFNEKTCGTVPTDLVDQRVDIEWQDTVIWNDTLLYNDVNDINDVPELLREQIKHFFENYKDLEKGKWVKVQGWGNAEEARDLIVKAAAAAK